MRPLAKRLLAEWRESAGRWERASRRWRPPGVEVYNPGLYAIDLYARFLERYPPSPRPVLALGLNPGPFGMAQTGIPFTDCRTASAILGIQVPLPGRAPPALRRRLLRENGRWRGTYERSSLGIYKALRLAWGEVKNAFENWVVVNACPLLFLDSREYRNLTPADARLGRLEGFQELRVAALEGFAEALEPRGIVCLGRDVSAALGPAAEKLVGARRTLHYPHPARAVPDLWASGLARELERRGFLSSA